MDNSFTIGSASFKLSKINALKQFHIVRRVAPILSELFPALNKLSKSNGTSEEEKLEQTAEFLSPVIEGLSKLSDKDSEFVLFQLLASVEMKQEAGNWARISNGEVMFFDNLDLPIMLQVAGRAFMYNMTGFFSAIQQNSAVPR